MIEFNTEYNYKDICNALGWHISTGAKRQNQIKIIEESFEYYHPFNKKTKKPKKSYIFTRQIKDIKDTKRDIFINLYNYISNIPHYQISVGNGYFLADTSHIYNAFFGIDIFDKINRLKANNNQSLVIVSVFVDDMLSVVKNMTIAKICRYEDVGKATLPKSIVRCKKRGAGLIEDYALLSTYEQYEQDFVNLRHYDNLRDVFFHDNQKALNEYVQMRFKEDYGINGIKKVNRVPLTHKHYKYDKNKVPEQQREYRLLLLDALTQKAYNRISAKPNSYSFTLYTDNQKDTYNHALMRLYGILGEHYRACAEEIAEKDLIQLIEDDDCDLSDYLD